MFKKSCISIAELSIYIYIFNGYDREFAKYANCQLILWYEWIFIEIRNREFLENDMHFKKFLKECLFLINKMNLSRFIGGTIKIKKKS